MKNIDWLPKNKRFLIIITTKGKNLKICWHSVLNLEANADDTRLPLFSACIAMMLQLVNRSLSYLSLLPQSKDIY